MASARIIRPRMEFTSISSFLLGSLGMQNGARVTLTQQTKYPTANTTQFQLDLERAEKFTIYVRVPAWADAKTRISINGKRVEGDLVAGRFFAFTPNLENGDRVEFEIGMPLSLQAVDAENPQIVALRRGPLALIGIGNLPSKFSRAQLLAASAASQSSEDWLVQGDAGKIRFRPFAAIGDENYRLYQIR